MNNVVAGIFEFYRDGKKVSRSFYCKSLKKICVSASSGFVVEASKNLATAFLIAFVTFVSTAASVCLNGNIAYFDDCEMAARSVVSDNPAGAVSLSAVFCILLIFTWFGFREENRRRFKNRKCEGASSLNLSGKLGVCFELLLFLCLLFSLYHFYCVVEVSIAAFSLVLLLLLFMLVSAYHLWVKLPRFKHFRKIGNSPVYFSLLLCSSSVAVLFFSRLPFFFLGDFSILVVFYEVLWFSLFGVWNFLAYFDFSIDKKVRCLKTSALKRPTEWLYSDAWFIFLTLLILISLLIFIFRAMMLLTSEFLAVVYWVFGCFF